MKPMFRTLEADEIEVRVARCTASGAQMLLYKDARCDQSILDETVGPMSWQRQHGRDNANCIVSIWDEDKKQWICKEDTGTESNTEAQKGLASDSFKRACVNWGIGRELYTSPFIWIQNCTEANNKGGYICKKSFKVSKIGYDGKRRINELEIVDERTGEKVFAMRKPAQFVCEKCGEALRPYKDKNGVEVSVKKHVAGSKRKFGKCLCLSCIEAMQNES